MWLIPIDFTSVAMFGVAMLLPFVPVTLLIVPLDKVLAGLKSFCFDLIDAAPYPMSSRLNCSASSS